MRNQKFYLAPAMRNGKIYLAPNDSCEKFYLAVNGLSEAFDTGDHFVLLQWLTKSQNVRDLALAWFALTWFESCLQERVQYVWHDRIMASPTSVMNTVPQESVLDSLVLTLYHWHTEYCWSVFGSLSFLLYTSDITSIVNLHSQKIVSELSAWARHWTHSQMAGL